VSALRRWMEGPKHQVHDGEGPDFEAPSDEPTSLWRSRLHYCTTICATGRSWTVAFWYREMLPRCTASGSVTKAKVVRGQRQAVQVGLPRAAAP
jgi:hypothetical protein